jgi:NAD-dependent dihydropyrimidine dehydrogenase PreA subunit
MAYVISVDKCTACGSCADNCPNGAIAPAEGGSHYVIDAEKCIDCGACETACPTGAITAGA